MKINIQYNIGKAKYVVNFSDGTKHHADGSELLAATQFSNENYPLPRCKHGKAMEDHAGNVLELPCGCIPTYGPKG